MTTQATSASPGASPLRGEALAAEPCTCGPTAPRIGPAASASKAEPAAPLRPLCGVCLGFVLVHEEVAGRHSSQPATCGQRQ